MATTVDASVAPDATIGAAFGSVASTVQLPGTPGSDNYARVVNMGPLPVALKLGTATPVAVTAQTGVVCMPGQTLNLTLGTNTYLGGIAVGSQGNSAVVNITTGL